MTKYKKKCIIRSVKGARPWRKNERRIDMEVMQDMGMTDNQYKGLLLEDLENWEEVLEMAKEVEAKEVIKKAEKQIKKINEKLKF